MSNSIPEHDISKFLETLRGLRIMDDVFMNEFVKRDKENGYKALNVILKAFTGLSLKVQTAKVQSLLTGAGGREIWLDIKAEDESGRIFDLEMQRSVRKDLPKRAVLHLSTIVTNKVHRGDSFDKVPEVWVIFVTETDFAGDGEATHHYQFRDENDELFNDPMHIVMVNGEYPDTSTLTRKVIHDIMTADPQAMLVSEIQGPFAYLKETERGQREMTEALEELVNNERKKTWMESLEQFVRNLMEKGFPFDQIVELTGGSPEEVQKVIDMIEVDQKSA